MKPTLKIILEIVGGLIAFFALLAFGIFGFGGVVAMVNWTEQFWGL